MQLTAVNDQNKMLKNQRKKLDDEVRRNQRFTVTLQAQATKLKSEIDELVLRNSTAEQEMVGFRNARETKMLEHDSLKLEVNKLKTSLSSRYVMSLGVSVCQQAVTQSRFSLRVPLTCAERTK